MEYDRVFDKMKHLKHSGKYKSFTSPIIFIVVRPTINVIFPELTELFQDYGTVINQEISQIKTILKTLGKPKYLNGETLTFQLLIRDAKGLPIENYKLLNPNISWKITNIEDLTKNKSHKSDIVTLEQKSNYIQLSYQSPFYDHKLQVFINDIEVKGSPKIIRLSSVGESLKCRYCKELAIQAFYSYQEDDYLGLCQNDFEKLYSRQGLCRRWNRLPQKCNLKSKSS